MLLGEQLRVSGVHFQEFLYVLQLGLGILDFAVYTLEGIGQLGSIAADLNGDALNLFATADTSEKGKKKETISRLLKNVCGLHPEWAGRDQSFSCIDLNCRSISRPPYITRTIVTVSSSRFGM